MNTYRFVFLAALLHAACTPDGDTVLVTQTQTVTIPSPGVVIGTPTPGANQGPVNSVGVGFFGGTCPTGELRNGIPLAVGCRGDVTATPKDAAGNKLEPVVHGSECQWTNDNPAAVTVFVDGENPFNAVVATKAVGTAKVCATVKLVTGCMTVEVR